MQSLGCRSIQLLRIFAGTLVDDTNKFVSDFLQGKHIRNLKDRDGNRMTDRYLVEKLSDEYPWLPNVYAKTLRRQYTVTFYNYLISYLKFSHLSHNCINF